ncbi:hypothetical protein VSS74_01285 [Conexibacter stalactiti]|uniref:Uncharacterized protein n=1 Tax=Conexibacter stalactiti TaxID=1940611 RepID=A0ABU4HI71_9ACTN|nr:hypothetical protein [Conexibacter stalactiti]MDW5592950.1 hypothetical protein [Conexibacter stalactiti]MEC5033591.1 hypothetical protein [Conexibacter stalactiti]
MDLEMSCGGRRVEQTLGSNLLEVRAKALRQDDEPFLVKRFDQSGGQIRVETARCRRRRAASTCCRRRLIGM